MSLYKKQIRIEEIMGPIVFGLSTDKAHASRGKQQKESSRNNKPPLIIVSHLLPFFYNCSLVKISWCSNWPGSATAAIQARRAKDWEADIGFLVCGRQRTRDFGCGRATTDAAAAEKAKQSTSVALFNTGPAVKFLLLLLTWTRGASFLLLAHQGLACLKRDLGTGPQCIPHPVLTAGLPHVPAAHADGVEYFVVERLDPVPVAVLLLGGQEVEIHGDLSTVRLEGQVIDVVAKGILDFAADKQNAQDYVRGDNCCRDGYPLQCGVQLKGQQENIDPGDLRNGNRVGNGQRRVEHTVCAHQDIIENSNVVVSQSLVHGDDELVVGHHLVGEAGEIRQDLQWQVAQRVLGPLNDLAWVACCKGDSEIATYKLANVGLGLVDLFRLLCRCVKGKGVEMADKMHKVIIAGVRFMPKFMFQSNGKSQEEVE